jgi:t-SNARE complex subunit (syntaxin)
MLAPKYKMKLRCAIRGANREGICLADSEAQGSAVRQSLVQIVRRQN